MGDGDAGATSAGGFGSGSGRSQGAHAKKTPSLGQGAIHAHGRLPPDVIQRVLRQNFGRFRLCYEDLLATNDKASGHVTGEFVINRDGTVTAAKDSGSDIGDATMISCMTNHFKTITFPKPESGIVTVSYPVIFAPGE